MATAEGGFPDRRTGGALKAEEVVVFTAAGMMYSSMMVSQLWMGCCEILYWSLLAVCTFVINAAQ